MKAPEYKYQDLRVANPLPNTDVFLESTIAWIVGAEVGVAGRHGLGDGETGGDPACGRDICAPADTVRLHLSLSN